MAIRCTQIEVKVCRHCISPPSSQRTMCHTQLLSALPFLAHAPHPYPPAPRPPGPGRPVRTPGPRPPNPTARSTHAPKCIRYYIIYMPNQTKPRCKIFQCFAPLGFSVCNIIIEMHLYLGTTGCQSTGRGRGGANEYGVRYLDSVAV